MLRITIIRACPSFGNRLRSVSRPSAYYKEQFSSEAKWKRKEQEFLKKRTSNKFAAKNSDILENEILFGRSVCNIALRASKRPVHRLHLLKLWETSEPTDSRVLEIINLAVGRRIPAIYSDRKSLDAMASHRPHQGVCLEVGELPFMDFDETSCKNAARNVMEVELSNPPLWVLLYGILDPMNMGAVLRSCFYFGIDKVLVAGHCAPMTPVVSKASSGAAEIISVYSAEAPTEIVKILAQQNWDVIGTVADSSISCKTVEDISDFKYDKPLLVVFGSEGSGIPSEMLDLCTRLVTIQSQLPAQTAVENSLGWLVGSLNVSTAAAIILHKLQQQKSRCHK